MASNKKVTKLNELDAFLKELEDYQYYSLLEATEKLKKSKRGEVEILRNTLVRKSGRLRALITELTGKEKLKVTRLKNGRESEYDIWFTGLRLRFNDHTHRALSYSIDITNAAIGKLKSDIEMGIRDEQGNLIRIEKKTTLITEPPKAFIAHEGETRALAIIKEFLEALGVQYFIAESKASSGRSIEKQVDWTQSNADFAICLATKGKAINKKTGKHYMAPNISDELGRARQVFGKKIILLVQKGVEVHTNIREIVYEDFTTTNMEKAFIKIAKELTNWGFIIAGKTEEQTS